MKPRGILYIFGGILSLISIGVAFGKPISLSSMLFRLRAVTVTDGTITFDRANSTRSGTTNTTYCNSRTGGSIICKTYNNDTSKSNGYIGALTTNSILKFYEPDGITEFTFQDLNSIRFDKITGTNTQLTFTLHALYDDGTTYTSNYTIKDTEEWKRYNFSTLGNVSNIWIECISTSTYVSQIKTITIVYNCSTKSQTGIEVSTTPAKTIYEEGEAFDPTGMLVKAVYSDNSKIATNSYTYSPSGSLSPTDEYITIYHNGFATQCPITVNALPELTGIYVSTAPAKTSYHVGDLFDPTGMVIKGTYEDGVDRVIDDYTYSPSTALTSSDDTITISYGNFSTTQSITVSDVSGPSGSYSVKVSSVVLTITFDVSTGTYTFKDWDSSVYSLNFSYTVSSSTVSITFVSYGSGTNKDSFANYRLFEGSTTSTTSTFNVDSDTMSVRTYTTYGSSSLRTFSK